MFFSPNSYLPTPTSQLQNRQKPFETKKNLSDILIEILSIFELFFEGMPIFYVLIVKIYSTKNGSVEEKSIFAIDMSSWHSQQLNKL